MGSGKTNGYLEYKSVIQEYEMIDLALATDEELFNGIRDLANEDGYYWEESSKVFATAKVTDEQLQAFLKSAAPNHNFTSGMFLSVFTLELCKRRWISGK